MYRVFAPNPDLLYWVSTTTLATGRAALNNHFARGSGILLFLQEMKANAKRNRGGPIFAPARDISHERAAHGDDVADNRAVPAAVYLSANQGMRSIRAGAVASSPMKYFT